MENWGQKRRIDLIDDVADTCFIFIIGAFSGLAVRWWSLTPLRVSSREYLSVYVYFDCLIVLVLSFSWFWFMGLFSTGTEKLDIQSISRSAKIWMN